MSMRLLTPEETALRLRTTVNTLKKWRVTGRYPALSNAVERGGAVVKRGRSVFYLTAAVEAFACQSQAL